MPLNHRRGSGEKTPDFHPMLSEDSTNCSAFEAAAQSGGQGTAQEAPFLPLTSYETRGRSLGFGFLPVKWG